MSNKLLVLGGSGFIGSHMCRLAVAEGHEVVSISPSGRPAGDEPWLDLVQWVEGDILQPETWRGHLQGVNAVIHSVGIVKEKPREGYTYERIVGDSVEIAAWEAEQAGVERFVFLSVQKKPPFISQRFLEAKRRAETALRRSQMRHIILRPYIVYGPDRPVTMPLGAASRRLSQWLHGDTPALRVEQVALIAVQAATDLDYEGGISAQNVNDLAGEAWKVYRPTSPSMRSLRPYLFLSAAAGLVAGLTWGLTKD